VDIEVFVRARLDDEASRMRPRALDRSKIVVTARRRRLIRGALVSTMTVASLGLVASLGVAVWDDMHPKGRTIVGTLSPASLAELETEATRTLKSFVRSLAAERVDPSWDLLSSRARLRIGSRDEWDSARRSFASFLRWVPRDDVDVVLAAIPSSSNDRFVATAIAPPSDGAALLQPLALVRDGDSFLIDLASADLSRSVSLEPVYPEFMSMPACAPPECAEIDWEDIHRGDSFSVILTPANEVETVWFSVGSEWVSEAQIERGDSDVVAEATFDGSGVDDGVKVFLVTIENRDGSLVPYGYRVELSGE
jgi:hypothetical protein